VRPLRSAASKRVQANLKGAFEGKLFPQDPNDEPASMLLERIRSTMLRETDVNSKRRTKAALAAERSQQVYPAPRPRGSAMSQNIRDQIVEQVERLDAPQQRQVLDFVRRLAAPVGVPGRELLRFSGSIDLADLEAMQRAIEGGCEQPENW